MIDTIKKEHYLPSTITIVSKIDKDLNVINIAKFLPVIHLFDKNNQRIKLISGSRNSIKYYGTENIILSVCYKKIRRGMRTGAMNNMVSIDIQILQKNIHVKLSSTSITCVGTSGIDQGNLVFNIIKEYIVMLNNNIKLCKRVSNNKLLDWLYDNCIDNHKLLRMSKLIDVIKKTEFTNDEKKFLNICSSYIDEFDIMDEYKYKINELLNCDYIFNTNFNFSYPNVYNSVYHCTLSNTLRLPLHKLAPYISKIGLTVEFHNWNSEGCNICFPIEEYKDGHITKEYKHRFTIHERSTMRQCSPTYHEESYKFYKILIKLLNKFIIEEEKHKNEYKKYIKETF